MAKESDDLKVFVNKVALKAQSHAQEGEQLKGALKKLSFIKDLKKEASSHKDEVDHFRLVF